MSELAKAGLTQVIDLADGATAAVSTTIDATLVAGRVTADAVVDTLGDSLDNALDNAERLRQEYILQIRRIANAVADAIPVG